MPTEPLKWTKYVKLPLKIKKKMTEIPPKLVKLPKYPLNLKNDWNTPETYKMTMIPSKPLKWP